MSGNSWERVPIDAQSVDAPLSQAAIFLVLCVADGEAALAKACSVLGGLEDLVKTVGFRDLSARLSCIAGIGSDLWDRLHPAGKPRELDFHDGCRVGEGAVVEIADFVANAFGQLLQAVADRLVVVAA